MTGNLKLPTIAEIIALYEIKPKKTLGQNFLLDTHITDQVVNTAGDLSGKCVLEIGAGPGCLTRSILASKARKVIAVETDKRCIEALGILKDAYPDRLEIIEADALAFNELELGEQKLTIIANLPYNIGTALVLKWMNNPALFENITVMLQKEVVDRICAAPNSKDYGRLSVVCQLLCDTEELMLVEPENFFPPPKIMSSIVRLMPLLAPRFECKLKELEKITQLAFSQRRKMLRSALKTMFTAADILAHGIDPTKRAEELTVEEFCRLCRLLKY